MTNEKKGYLPIGSVVLLKNSNRRIMIVGVKQKQVDSETTWDYSGCLYPEGIIDPNRLYLFNREQIARLFFLGFQDPESLKFSQYLRKLDSESQENNNNN